MLLLLETLNEKNNYAVLKRDLLVVTASTEPVCLTIGRKTDCDLSFPLDKSISRKHCNLTVYPNGAITVTDLKSSFGTFLNGIKCPPHEESHLGDKIHFKFGNEFTNIRISKFKFCNTRLDKTEKDRLKVICRMVGGEMVKQLEHSSHLLCNRYSATVKILQALVTQKPIVSFGFAEALVQVLSFPEVADAAADKKKLIHVTPPLESDFKPMESVSIANITDPLESRAKILTDHTVILLEAGDEQYLSILSNCGAYVLNLISMSPQTTSQLLMQEVDNLLKDGGEAIAERTCSIFFEDSKSPSAKTILLSRAAHFPFFNTGALAMSIFENLPPKLLPADTLAQRALSQQQSNSQMLSSQLYFDTTTTPAHSSSVHAAPSAAQTKASVVLVTTDIPPPNSIPASKLVSIKKEREEDEEGQRFNSSEGGKRSVNGSGGRVMTGGGEEGLARVTTLIPTQDTDRLKKKLTATENNINNDNNRGGKKLVHPGEKLDRAAVDTHSTSTASTTPPPNLLSKPVKKTETEKKAVPLNRKSNNNNENHHVDSPVQMCDINIEVDLSAEPHPSTVESGASDIKREKEKGEPNSCGGLGQTPLKNVKKTIDKHLRISGQEIQGGVEESMTNQKQKKRKAPEAPAEQESRGEDIEFSAPPPRSRRKKQSVMSSGKVGLDLGESFTLGTGDSQDEVDENLYSANNEDEEEDEGAEGAMDVSEGGGWCVSNRSSDKKKRRKQSTPLEQQVALEKRKQVEEARDAGEETEAEEIVYPQAVSVEVHLALRDTHFSASIANEEQVQGQKRFVKNYVRGHFQRSGTMNDNSSSREPHLIISLRHMDKLLPKESERELQLQRSYEEDQRQLAQRDELFSERIEKGKGKGKRKLFG